MMSAEHIHVSLGQRDVLRDVSLDIVPGTLCALTGPNGAGKSTLLRVLAGLLAPKTGRVSVQGDDISTLTIAERARRIAWLPQSRPVAWNLAVEDLVALGRFNGRAMPYARVKAEDRDAIDHALQRTGAMAFAGRDVQALSGGELARVHLARTFASSAPILLLDEPAAALDLRHQIELIALLKEESANGRTIVFSAHDLALVRQSHARTLVLHHGSIVADGAALDVPDTSTLKSVFGVAKNPDGYFVSAPDFD